MSVLLGVSPFIDTLSIFSESSWSEPLSRLPDVHCYLPSLSLVGFGFQVKETAVTADIDARGEWHCVIALRECIIYTTTVDLYTLTSEYQTTSTTRTVISGTHERIARPSTNFIHHHNKYTMAAKQDKFVQALIGEPRLEPSMVKLRSAMSTMNQYNLSEVTATANAFLARLSHSDKPKTFSELLQRIRQVYPQPHADLLAIKGAGDDDFGLSALMALTSLEKPVPKAEAAALGLATAFKPKQYSTFYDPDASFAASLTLIF